MPLSYAKNKVHIYKYVEANRNKHNEYQNEYRKEHRELYNKSRMRYYYFNVEAKRLRDILL